MQSRPSPSQNAPPGRAGAIAEGSPLQTKQSKDGGFLLNTKQTYGARSVPPKTPQDSIVRPTKGSKQDDACKWSKASLTQFYIGEEHGRTKGVLYPQQPDICTAIYYEGHDSKLFDTHNVNDKGTETTCKWIHLHANNEKWLHDLFLQLKRHDNSTRTRQHRGPAPFDRHIVPGVCEYSHDYNGVNTDKRAVTALFMPVLGFETHRNRKQLSAAMKAASLPSDQAAPPSEQASPPSEKASPPSEQASPPSEQASPPSEQASPPSEQASPPSEQASPPSEGEIDERNKNLIDAYFQEATFPLHCRRTLDQFTYHMLHDTETRDNSQVMFKWQGEKERNKPNDSERFPEGRYPLLMVDQLWLHVLEDEKIVVTSLPDTWEPSSGYNLIKHLMEDKLKGNNNQQPIKSPIDLANFVIQGSIDCLRRKGPLGATVYESFQSRIASIASEQYRRFEDFNGLVCSLNKPNISQQEKADFTDKIFRRTAETDLLAEIVDVKDELNTIRRVFLKQRDVLKAFHQRLIKQRKGKSKNRDSTSGPQPPRDQPRDQQVSYRGSDPSEQAGENMQLIEANITIIKEMEADAEQVRAKITSLISRAQKQANAWEARFAREGSDHAQRQSNITLVFTIVTVFFLPLSFMASVFAIQIDVFPHDEKTGELNWPVGEAMGLLFGISFAAILLVALLGFHINRISRFFIRPPEPTNTEGHADDHTDRGKDLPAASPAAATGTPRVDKGHSTALQSGVAGVSRLLRRHKAKEKDLESGEGE